MLRRAAVVLLVASGVVLAGCQFDEPGTDVGGPSTATEIDTDAPTATDTDTPAATPGPFDGASPPPGVAESGVTDVDALLAAHASTANGTAVTVDVDFYLTENGTGRNVSLRARTIPGSDRGWLRADLANGVGTYYTEDGTTYYREEVEGRTSYGTTTEVSAIPDRPRFGADERIRTAVASAEWAPVGTVERDGRTLFEFRATAVDPPDVNATEDATVSSDGRLLVDAEGVVHHVEVETTVETDRGTVRYGTTVSLSEFGSTTVDRPDWFDDAADS